ncbi:CAP-Gly domain-containing linker protein 1 [Danaus plexippus plexippus]|uniref:CAP-Gly domain-containing linker protein 1 n=1 Tax=Danaus plexippus plexippus TaxID=278856 RepID=A0A212EN90_DANPL|nr:CAP-Gly domain-containing linker protein 1 [Danaus plexippus plexippus]
MLVHVGFGTDLIEAEEDEVSSSLPERRRSYRRVSTSSRSSVTSMDTLWEKYPRRLSEAGLRRSSDHSVVLTEDTDSFIIGERVWVGGTKPGLIAYIGETQFAPGEWAGIVLDDPIGKNDGSVAGVRYFQCPEKRGVFSRLTRLTREPLASHGPHDASPISDAGSVFERPPSGSARPRRAHSPNGSVRSMVSSKMNASISTTTNGDLRLGDRVIVSSSRGSKAGTLRFVGPTEFASGVWGGVELDDPLGKNDGSVDGKRYFECSPRFGLFAPISKVSRSPSNRKPGSCAIHSNGRATPLRRSNSRESLTSLGTSIASSRAGVRLGVTSLGAQELLREKQMHLEKLMRERELERAEVAKVSIQADRSETALAQIKKEATQINNENAKLKAELDKLNKMLEDERQKVEDLMFRNEEENINKEDYNIEKLEREKLIRDLEAEVALQAARAETTAATLRVLEDQRSAEMSALAEQHKEELVAAQKLQKLLDEAYALLQEKESEKDSLGKSLSEELSKVKIESERALNEARTKLAIAQTEFETQVSVMNAKLQLAESKLETEKQNVERLNKDSSEIVIDLNNKLIALQAMVDDKTLEFNKVTGASKEHEVNLNKEITKLKMELSAKILDLEQLEDAKKKQETLYKALEDEAKRVQDELSSKVSEYESILNEASQKEENSKSEIMKLQQEINTKTKDYEKLRNETSQSINANEKLIDEHKQTIHERDKEIIKLKDEYENMTASFNIKHTKIAEEHKKEIENRNTKIEELTKEIENHKQALNQSKIELDTLNTQFTLNNDELNALKEENMKLKQSLNELTNANTELKSQIAKMELEIGEYKRQLASSIERCEEIQKSKETIETEYMNLTGQTTDSNEQFNKLSQHLKNTENELQAMKDKYRDASNSCGRIEQEFKQKIFKLQENFAMERGQLVNSIDDYVQKLNASENKIKEFEVLINEATNRLHEFENQNDKLLDENMILKTEIENLRIREQEINNEHDAVRKNIEIELEKHKEEITALKADGATSEVKLMEKVDQLTEAQNDLNNKLEEARKHEDSLQKLLEDMTTQVDNQKHQYEKEVNHLQEQLVSVNETLNAQKQSELQLKQALEDKQNAIKELFLKVEMLEVDVRSNCEIINEKNNQLSQANEELNKMTDLKNRIEEQLNSSLLEASKFKQQYETLLHNSTAGESLLKEQLDQLESVKTQLGSISNEKTLLEEKYNETCKEVANLRNELEDTGKNLKDNLEIIIELKRDLSEKELVIRSQNEKNDTCNNKSQLLTEDILKLQEEVNNKNNLLEQKQKELTVLNETLLLETKKTQETIRRLENEGTELKSKYASETESLNNTIKTLQHQLDAQQQLLGELQSSKEKVSDLEQLLSKSENDIKKLTNINEAQKVNYEDLNKQLQKQYDDYKKDSKAIRNDLKNKINDYEKQLQDSKDRVASELDEQNKLREKLVEADNKLLDLSQKLELISVQQSNNESKDERLEKLTLELQETRRNGAEALANSEKTIAKLRVDIENSIRDINVKDNQIKQLLEDLKTQKAKVEIAEREKVILQKEMVQNSKDVRDKNDNAAGLLGQGDTAQQKADDKEVIDGQVSFLNSVIVDMQRKNEQLTARVQALEGATVAPEPPLFNGRKTRAPRLFCDICDVFDAHDTDDCPRQSAEPTLPTERKPPPPPRPLTLYTLPSVVTAKDSHYVMRSKTFASVTETLGGCSFKNDKITRSNPKILVSLALRFCH